MYCLPQRLANKFIEKLKDGSINPAKLAEMSSEGRRTLFQTFMGEIHAKHTNSLFESKLLLKNQQMGMITWAKTVSGMKPEAQRDILNKVNKMTEILTPASEKAFLEDLVAHKLQTRVTIEQANKICELAKTATENKTVMESSPRRSGVDGKATDTEMDYGEASIAFTNYTDNLKSQAKRGFSMLSIPGIAAGASRAIRSSWDISFVGRQGVSALLKAATGDFRSGKIWFQTVGVSLKQFSNAFGDKKAMDHMHAMMISDPEYNTIKKMGVSLMGTVEEEIPINIQNKIPVIGKIFEGSENAYVGAAEFMRYKLAKTYLEIGRYTKADMDDKNTLEAFGSIVNTLTGRTSGQRKPGWENAVIWAPNLIKSNINILTGNIADPRMRGQGFGKKGARYHAAVSSLRIIGGIAVMAAIANTIRPGSVEWEDPTNADFMKLKVGNQRIDFTGGKGQYVILAARLLTGSRTDSTTGIKKEYGSGYGEASRMDAIFQFLTYKTSPVASMGVSFAKGTTFEGDTPDLGTEILKLYTPLPVEQIYKANKEGWPLENQILNAISEELGFSSNIYSSDVNWSQNPGVVLQQFRDKVGEKRFKTLNDEFNTKFNLWFKLTQTNSKYKALSDEDKQKVITKKKMDIKADIFKKNFFKYKSAPTKKLPNF